MIVIIETGVLGLLCNPKSEQGSEVQKCLDWFYTLPMQGKIALSLDICEYELRRNFIQECLNGNNISKQSISILDELRTNKVIDFLPLTRDVLVSAARVWADLRIHGQPTANDAHLDIDCIIGAHYQLLKEEKPGQSITVATTNVKHISRFANAKEWHEI